MGQESKHKQQTTSSRRLFSAHLLCLILKLVFQLSQLAVEAGCNGVFFQSRLALDLRGWVGMLRIGDGRIVRFFDLPC